MPPILLVMLGGGAGSGLRYLVGMVALRLFGPALPWGTFAVNLTGGFAMGLLVGLLVRLAGGANETLRLLIGVGVLGGYTTFSSFSLDVVTMLNRGQALLALGYAIASAAGAVLLLSAGLAVARGLPA